MRTLSSNATSVSSKPRESGEDANGGVEDGGQVGAGALDPLSEVRIQ